MCQQGSHASELPIQNPALVEAACVEAACNRGASADPAKYHASEIFGIPCRVRKAHTSRGLPFLGSLDVQIEQREPGSRDQTKPRRVDSACD